MNNLNCKHENLIPIAVSINAVNSINQFKFNPRNWFDLFGLIDGINEINRIGISLEYYNSMDNTDHTGFHVLYIVNGFDYLLVVLPVITKFISGKNETSI